jgi:hypothetical protein
VRRRRVLHVGSNIGNDGSRGIYGFRKLAGKIDQNGVFVLFPTPGRAIVRRTNSFRDLLCQRYDFFYFGIDHSGTFTYSRLFLRGSTILITFNSYKTHTEESIAIVNHLQEQGNEDR